MKKNSVVLVILPKLIILYIPEFCDVSAISFVLWIKYRDTVAEFKILFLYSVALVTYSFMDSSAIVSCDNKNGIGSEQG